ncbi:hypothetical protein RYH73_15600 [Olivibacter sp. CPCC 100613]|uniref:hypothetical protein n=1 Tax=Olivibacter sp. CPCC 100613 TaxID=3079931 RepID=UPI002FFA94EE
MKQRLLFEGNALWIHDFEIQQLGHTERFTIRHLSLAPPLAKHQGHILLTETEIILDGSEYERIPLSAIEELYYGFDEYYTPASVKNFGVFWKPIRIKYSSTGFLYLIVNYRYFYTSNEHVLSLLKDILVPEQ